MRTTERLSVKLVMAAAWVGLAGIASAGMLEVPCKRVTVFPQALVNVVVVPYESSGVTGLTREAHQAARRMGYLVHLDTLFSIARYGSVGVTQLKDSPSDDPDCAVDNIWARLIGAKEGAKARVHDDHGLVLFWGRLYKQEGQLYIQSNVQFGRVPRPEVLDLEIRGVRFAGRLATQTVSFTPTRLSMDDLATIEAAFDRTMVLREAPSETARDRPLPSRDSGAPPVAFYVTDLAGGWMQVRSMGGEFQGWLPARVALGATTMRNRLPELVFVEALAAFLRLRGPRPGPGSNVAAAQAVDENLERFLESTGARAKTAGAVANQIRGLLRLPGGGLSVDLAAAHAFFARAATLLPDSADARNLEVITRTAVAYVEPARFRARATAADLALAASLVGKDRLLLQNVAALFRLFIASDQADAAGDDRFTREELERGLVALEPVLGGRPAAAHPWR